MQSMKLSEKRSSPRVDVTQDVRFRMRNKRGDPFEGYGYTLNLSGTGVLFRANVVPVPGQELELAIDWPALREHTSKVELLVHCRVVRFERNVVAAAIERYEFVES
jgi:hypothetical protein